MENYRALRSEQVSFENKIRSLITEIRFSCIGNVSKVYAEGKRIDVILPYLTVNNEPITLKGIEVLRYGTHKVKISYTPEVGDAVIVLAMQNYNGTTQFSPTPLPRDKCPYFELYGNTTMKAILVQTNEDNEDAINISVNNTDVEVTCPGTITVNCESDVTIDASNVNVNLNAKKFSVNDTSLTVE